MSQFHAIQRVMSRINSIKQRINQVSSPQALQVNHMQFNSSLKMAMGNQNNLGAMGVNGLNTPDSLQALLSRAGGSAALGIGGITASQAGQRLADYAAKMDGKEFKPGQRERCADFVSQMVKDSGIAPPDFKHEVNCWELQKQGKKVEKKDLKPGDIVYFGYTYLPTDYTHVGIYLGDGKFVHRPTAAKPVVVDRMDQGYYAEKFCGARRLKG